MGYYHVNKIELNGTMLETRIITYGETKGNYPELSAFGLGNYQALSHFYTATPYLLYMFNDKE